MSSSSSNDNESQFRTYLFDLLARREYTRVQLERKLSSKGADSQLIERLLDQFEADGYQSDVRFADIHVRQRVQSGYGVRRIFYELQQKGVSAELIESALEEQGTKTHTELLSYIDRKYQQKPPKDKKDEAKRYRHLMSRGFQYDEIKQAFKESESDCF